MDIQLKKGLLDACVLKCLEKESSYGYKILEDLPKHIEMTVSTLYPILKRLEQNSFVITYSEEHGGRLRHYYTITQKGKGKLRSYCEDLVEVIKIFRYISGETA